MAEAQAVRCDQCGQVDTDPMVHFWDGRSVHNDCASVEEQEQIRGSTDENAAKVLDACLAGKRGEELREFSLGSKSASRKGSR